MKKRMFMALIILFCVIPINTYAYKYIGYKWNSNSIKYYYTNSIFASGAQAWGGLDATLSYSSTYYGIICEVVSAPNAPWDGISYVAHDRLNIQSVTMNINSAATKTWQCPNALKSVVAHEFGHALGLDENGTTCTIMNSQTFGPSSRYGEYRLTTPQTDDKKGINIIY